MTAREAKVQFLKQAQSQNTHILYVGPWADCPSDIMEQWVQAAQRNAAEQYETVDTALAQRIYLDA